MEHTQPWLIDYHELYRKKYLGRQPYKKLPPRETDQEVIYVRQKDTPFSPKKASPLKRRKTTYSTQNTLEFLEKMDTKASQKKTAN